MSEKLKCTMCGEDADHEMAGHPACINCDSYMGIMTFPEVPRDMYPWIEKVHAHSTKQASEIASLRAEVSRITQTMEDERGVFMSALELMQQYNGRSVQECIQMARKEIRREFAPTGMKEGE